MSNSCTRKKFGVIATFSRGLTYAKGDVATDSTKRVLRSNNIDLQSHSLNFDEIAYLKEEFIIPDEKKLHKGDIFICMSNGSTQHLGKVAFVEEDLDYAFGGFMGAIHPDANIVFPKYAFYACLSSEYRRFLASIFNGININNLKWSDLSNLEIPIPSLDEQKRIVAELDLLTEIIDKQKQQLKELDNLAQSIFYDMFGNPVENEKGWKKGSIGSFAKCIAGATPSTSNRSYWENGTIPWLSSGEVANGRIFNTEKKISILGYDNCSTKLVPAHTILIAMAGQGKTRGTVGITEISLCTNQSICSILSNETVNVDFIYYQLRHLYNELRSISNGDGGRGGLNLKIIQAFKLILPPKGLQDVFAKKIHSVESQLESIKKSIIESQKLFEYTMNKHFG